MQPRLSGPCLSRTSIIRTSQRPTNTLPRMYRRRDRWSFVGVVADWAMSYGLYRLVLAKNWLIKVLFSTLLAMIILYRYRLLARYHKPGEKYRHFSYPDISLIRYGSNQPVDKGVRIIEVALYQIYMYYSCPILTMHVPVPVHVHVQG